MSTRLAIAAILTVGFFAGANQASAQSAYIADASDFASTSSDYSYQGYANTGDSNAYQGYIYSYYAQICAQYADDFDASGDQGDADSYAYYASLYADYASTANYNAYSDTGDVDCYYAYLYSTYASDYAYYASLGY